MPLRRSSIQEFPSPRRHRDRSREWACHPPVADGADSARAGQTADASDSGRSPTQVRGHNVELSKEGLVATPGSWPGPNCIAALTTGEILRGTWFDRSAEFIARQRGETVLPLQFATTFDINLTPLPCLQHLMADQRQAECRRIVGEIQAEAEAENKEKGRKPMGVAAILSQDPHGKPASTDRSPAPFVHATDDSAEMEFRVRYRAFVEAFRAGAGRLRERAREIRDMFPLWAFPPQLPFNETA